MSPAVVWPGLWQKRVLILCVHSISVVCMQRFRSRKHRPGGQGGYLGAKDTRGLGAWGLLVPGDSSRDLNDPRSLEVT